MPLDKTCQPTKSTAIIPFQSSDYLGSDHESLPPEKVVRVVNAVLNTLSKSTDDKIIGPSELDSVLETRTSVKKINDCFTIPKSQECQMDSLISLFCEAGIENIVQIKVTVSEHYYKYSDTVSSGGFFGTRRNGQVRLMVDLLNLKNEKIETINSSSGSAEYGSNKGWMVGASMGGAFAIPYIYGKTLGRAVDQAAREALSALFSLQEQTPFSPLQPIVVDKNNQFDSKSQVEQPVIQELNDITRSKQSEQVDRKSYEYDSSKKYLADNNDGTITDHRTGLMWQKSGSDRTMSFRRTKTYIKNLNEGNYAGYSDWRLPSAQELATLLEEEKVNKRHYAAIFEDRQTRCWTKDRCEPHYPQYLGALIVNFTTGEISKAYWSRRSFATHGAHRQNPENYIKAVRTVRVSQ